MQIKNVSFIVLILAYLLALSACNNTPNSSNTATESGAIHIDSHYTISTNEDLTYSYRITAKNGDILFSDDHSPREPKINQISDNIFSVIIQTGTDRSTNWAVFCDVENSKTSETFYYVLAAQGDHVVCADYKDNKYFITVQNIFDKSVYSKTYELENVSPVAADFALGCEFDGDNNAIITYLTGEEYNETKITIDIP